MDLLVGCPVGPLLGSLVGQMACQSVGQLVGQSKVSWSIALTVVWLVGQLACQSDLLKEFDETWGVYYHHGRMCTLLPFCAAESKCLGNFVLQSYVLWCISYLEKSCQLSIWYAISFNKTCLSF